MNQTKARLACGISEVEDRATRLETQRIQLTREASDLRAEVARLKTDLAHAEESRDAAVKALAEHTAPRKPRAKA